MRKRRKNYHKCPKTKLYSNCYMIFLLIKNDAVTRSNINIYISVIAS